MHHYILDRISKLWAWLISDSANRAATVILVFVTCWYVILTRRMAKAIDHQIRAQIQPVVLLQFHWKENGYAPTGYFEIKNLGTQPLLILDVKLTMNLWCGIMESKRFTDSYILWDEQLIPPGESLRPKFDFRRQLEQDKLSWEAGRLSYSLEVVASDLSKQVVLRHCNIPVLSIVNVRKGMPLSVRWRYFLKPFNHLYPDLRSRFARLKALSGTGKSANKPENPSHFDLAIGTIGTCSDRATEPGHPPENEPAIDTRRESSGSELPPRVQAAINVQPRD